ncbi:MAG: hypothetical protein AB7U82_27950 [Blastocatellales bacterium]
MHRSVPLSFAHTSHELDVIERRILSLQYQAEPQRSEGHIAFAGEFEFYADQSGSVHRAKVDTPIDATGYRPGRFEAMPVAWQRFGAMILADCARA